MYFLMRQVEIAIGMGGAEFLMANAFVIPFTQPAIMVVDHDGILLGTCLRILDCNITVLFINNVVQLGQQAKGFVLGIGNIAHRSLG